MEHFSFKDVVLTLFALMGVIYTGILLVSAVKPDIQGLLNADISAAIVEDEQIEESSLDMEPIHGYDDVDELINVDPYPKRSQVACRWYYNRLDNEQQIALYDAIDAGILGLRPMIAIDSPMTEDEVSEVFWAVIYDHPEYFWVSKLYTYHMYEDGNVGRFEMHFHEQDKAEIEEKMKRYSSMADAIIGGTSAEYGGDAALPGIYDWILANTSYSENDRDQDMTSVFDDHKSVCAGYVQAMQYVALRAGIPCVRISGQSREAYDAGEDSCHTWLAIVTYGDLAYYDPTWGDQSGNGYKYYAMTQEELEEGHVFASDKAPRCDYDAGRDDSYAMEDESVAVNCAGIDTSMSPFDKAVQTLFMVKMRETLKMIYTSRY